MGGSPRTPEETDAIYDLLKDDADMTAREVVASLKAQFSISLTPSQVRATVAVMCKRGHKVKLTRERSAYDLLDKKVADEAIAAPRTKPPPRSGPRGGRK